MFVWQAHKGKVRSLAFSPDGSLLATATGTGRIVSLWNPLTGEQVRKVSPKSQDRAANAVAFAPAAPLFAVGLHSAVHVWNTRTWEPVAVLTGLQRWSGAYFELAFGPGPAPRLAAGDARSAHVWEDAGRPALDPPHPADKEFGINNVPCLDFSPSGDRLAVNVLGEAALFDPLTGTRASTLWHPHSRHHGPIRFSPDGTRIAIGYRNLVDVRRADGAGQTVTCTGHTGLVWSAGWSADGKSLFTASDDGTARQWNPDTGAELRTFEWGIGEILCTAFSADGLLGAAAGRSGKIVVWDLDE
jgi:WD40 repeat protein